MVLQHVYIFLCPPISFHTAVPVRDSQGHVYNAKDIHVRFVEPMAEAHCDSKLRLILDSTVRWTESKIKETERRKGYMGFIHLSLCSSFANLCFLLIFLVSLAKYCLLGLGGL